MFKPSKPEVELSKITQLEQVYHDCTLIMMNKMRVYLIFVGLHVRSHLQYQKNTLNEERLCPSLILFSSNNSYILFQ